jgi:hypothetical protein
MRTDLYLDRRGWLYTLDYRKVIIIAFLVRVIAASMYDAFVLLTDRDILLPDSKFYSTQGRYIAFLLNGNTNESLTMDILPKDPVARRIFYEAAYTAGGRLPPVTNETALYIYIIGLIYLVFGYFPLGVRIFNISLSVLGAYFVFKIAKRCFGDLAANVFLLIGLFLPTQFIYSITLSKDFIRTFLVYFVLWIIFGGALCPKRQKE